MDIKESDVISYISFVLNRYIKGNKLLDSIGCDELIKSLIIYNELNDYVKDVTYENSKDYKTNMSYSYFNKRINITKDFIQGIKPTPKQLLDLFKVHDEIIIRNLDIVHALIHEIIHAKQYKLIDNTADEFIKNILRKSLTAYSYLDEEDKESALKYAEAVKSTNLYHLLPSELNAEILAIKQTIEIINHVSINGKYKYINMYEFLLKLTQIKSYEKKTFTVKSPFDKFIKTRKKYLKEPIKYSSNDIKKYNIEERLSYGLPISIFEYNQLNNEINEIIKTYMKNG